MELIISFFFFYFFFLGYTSNVAFSLFQNYLSIFNLISFFILLLIIFNLKNIFINIIILLSFFNILLITIFSEILYWCDILYFGLPIPLIDLILLPLIIYFSGLLNRLLVIFIIKITKTFSFLFNLVMSVFLVNPIFIFLYFLIMISMCFTANLFFLYFVYSLVLNICLVILRMPYLFELIDSSNIIENLFYIKNNLDNLDSSYIISENTLVSNLVFSIIFTGYKKNKENTRFITTTTKSQTGLTELVLTKFFKIKGIYIKPETLKAFVVIAQEHPRQTAGLFIAAGVPITYAFIIHGYKLKLNHEARLTQLKTELEKQVSADQVVISNNQTVISNNQTIISNNEMLISNNNLELAKLKQSNMQIIDVTPVSLSPSNNIPINETGTNSILQCSFEMGENLEFISTFLNKFLIIFFDIML